MALGKAINQFDVATSAENKNVLGYDINTDVTCQIPATLLETDLTGYTKLITLWQDDGAFYMEDISFPAIPGIFIVELFGDGDNHPISRTMFCVLPSNFTNSFSATEYIQSYNPDSSIVSFSGKINFSINDGQLVITLLTTDPIYINAVYKLA